MLFVDNSPTFHCSATFKGESDWRLPTLRWDLLWTESLQQSVRSESGCNSFECFPLNGFRVSLPHFFPCSGPSQEHFHHYPFCLLLFHSHPNSSLSLLIAASLRFTQSRHIHCFECVLVIGLLSLNLSWSISFRFSSSFRLLLTVFTVS